MAARPYFLLSAATTNFTYLGNCNLVGGYIINTNAAIRYVKFYNAPVGGAVPVLGTTVPFLTFQCTASGASTLDAAIPDMEALQSSGPLWMATTANIAASDTTAVGAGDLYIHLAFEG